MSEKDVADTLREASEHVPDDMKLDTKLEIIEIKDLTKVRDDNSKPWCRNWMVRVPHEFRDYMLRPEALPTGWTSRKYFPARQRRPNTVGAGAQNHFKRPLAEFSLQIWPL